MRIICADDDRSMRESLNRLLFIKGHEVVDIVSDGSELLEKLDPVLHEVVITDGHMRRVGGIEVLRHIKSTPALRHITVFVVSADDRIADHVKALGGIFIDKMYCATTLPARLAELSAKKE